MEDTKGLSYFFLGVGVGVAVGMMFAPKPGTETREQLRSKAQEGGEYVKRRTGELRENATGLVDKGRELIGKQKQQVASALDAGRQAYRDTLVQTRDAGDRTAGDIIIGGNQGI